MELPNLSMSQLFTPPLKTMKKATPSADQKKAAEKEAQTQAQDATRAVICSTTPQAMGIYDNAVAVECDIVVPPSENNGGNTSLCSFDITYIDLGDGTPVKTFDGNFSCTSSQELMLRLMQITSEKLIKSFNQ